MMNYGKTKKTFVRFQTATQCIVITFLLATTTCDQHRFSCLYVTLAQDFHLLTFRASYILWVT